MYEVAIIGGGPAGIEAARVALTHRLKTVLIERDFSSWGGTCLNKGCIPTKLYLEGIKKKQPWDRLVAKKNEVIDFIKNTSIKSLQQRGLEIIWGEANFLDRYTLKVNNKKIEAKYIIIATGSVPVDIFCEGKKNVKLAEDLFSFSHLEGEKFLVVGAGAIGLEFASLLNTMGKEVTIVEKQDRILPSIDSTVTERLIRIFEKNGINIVLSSDFSYYDISNFDLVFICVGRRVDISNLGLEEIGIELDTGGRIKVNSFMQTTVENIYACGDVASSKMYAYVAEYQARICIKNIVGEKVEYNEKGIPECVFSIPQIAKVGYKEEELKKGSYKVISANFKGLSSSYVYDDEEGFVRIIVSKDNKKVLGATVVSNLASEIIHILSLVIREEIPLDRLKDQIFVHPTISEVIPSILRRL